MTAPVPAGIVEAAARSHLRLDDGTTWPNPHDPKDVQWRLRYGTPTREDLLFAASVMHGYTYLATEPPGTRRLASLRRAVRSLAERLGDE